MTPVDQDLSGQYMLYSLNLLDFEKDNSGVTYGIVVYPSFQTFVFLSSNDIINKIIMKIKKINENKIINLIVGNYSKVFKISFHLSIVLYILMLITPKNSSVNLRVVKQRIDSKIALLIKMLNSAPVPEKVDNYTQTIIGDTQNLPKCEPTEHTLFEKSQKYDNQRLQTSNSTGCEYEKRKTPVKEFKTSEKKKSFCNIQSSKKQENSKQKLRQSSRLDHKNNSFDEILKSRKKNNSVHTSNEKKKQKKRKRRVTELVFKKMKEAIGEKNQEFNECQQGNMVRKKLILNLSLAISFK